MNPEIEKRLVADHAEVAGSRRTVSFWNFLPPDDLNAILTLYTKVTQEDAADLEDARDRGPEAP